MEHSTQPQEFSELLEACRDQVLQSSHALLTDLFMGSDDALLEAAEKAPSNLAQSRYFEAMREIRRNRVAVEHTFRQQILNGFEMFSNGQPISAGIRHRRSDNRSKLALVKKADVEESVAIQNIISKANNNFFHTLYELRQRLAVINRGKKVDSTNMPSGPSHLCNAFWLAVQAFEVEREVKLILFSLFDRFVMRKASVIYDGFNKQLFDAGILPDISSVIRKELETKQTQGVPDEGSTAQEPKPDRSRQEPQEMGEQAGKELYQSLFQLLAVRRQNGPQEGSGYYSEQSGSDYRQPIDRRDLATAINEIQPPATSLNYSLPAGGESGSGVQVLVDEQLLESIRQTLITDREKLFANVSESKQSVNLVDADTIELVGMLFEFMLNYEALPNAAKALISHLHTPFLRVAVLDKQFLIRSSHSARRLLNMMVDAGSRWINETSLETGIFPNMQEIVERVLDEFKDDLTLFDELAESFSSTIEEFKTKTQVIENRSREAAKGRDKLQVAKQQAREEVTARIGLHRLPDEVAHFLLKPWTDRLTFILLRTREGKESSDWKAAMKIVDALIWAVGPKNSEHDRRRLKQVLPKLRSSVEEGLAALGEYSHIHTEVLFETIEAQQHRPARIASHISPAAAPASGTERKTGGEAGPAAASPGVATTSKASDDKLPADEQSIVDKLKKTEYGTWFELNARDRERRVRAKLSWFSPITGNCMFVDNTGVQCRVIAIGDLAKEVHAGDARILKYHKAAFVDRALKAIRNMLAGATKQPA